MAPQTTARKDKPLNDTLQYAWEQGYAAGWKDQECDFPPHTSENPYTEGNQ